MKRFKNMLIVSNSGKEPDLNAALIRGQDLAKRNNARLTLMEVIKAPQKTMRAYEGIMSAEELTALLVKESEKKLHHAAELLKADNIETETKVAVGRNFIETIRQMQSGNHDLLIKLASQESESFDSDDFHLMRKCPRPVWLIRPRHPGKCKRVLAAIDPTLEETGEGSALNTLIIDLATSLAEWEESDLYLLSCWSLYGESALRHSVFAKVTEEKIAQILRDEEAANRACLDYLTEHYNDNRISKVLIKGDPKKCIPQFVKRHGIDVVIMGTVGRTGIQGLFIGNTAETVLKSIDSSVITLKPAGFKSPIHG